MTAELFCRRLEVNLLYDAAAPVGGYEHVRDVLVMFLVSPLKPEHAFAIDVFSMGVANGKNCRLLHVSQYWGYGRELLQR